jgi:hypothetical protein
MTRTGVAFIGASLDCPMAYVARPAAAHGAPAANMPVTMLQRN